MVVLHPADDQQLVQEYMLHLRSLAEIEEYWTFQEKGWCTGSRYAHIIDYEHDEDISAKL